MSFARTYSNYICIGILYGGCRSWYWSDKVKDTVYLNNKEIEHPMLFSDKVIATSFNLLLGMSPLWPVMTLQDYKVYEKKKYGVTNYLPFPYNRYSLK